jgi:hypothetical protein
MQEYQVIFDTEKFVPTFIIKAETYKVSKAGNVYFFTGNKPVACVPAGKWACVKQTRVVSDE